MPKFKVKKGYAYYPGGDIKNKLGVVPSGKIVELNDINDGNQKWKLEEVEAEVKKESPKKSKKAKKESSEEKLEESVAEVLDADKVEESVAEVLDADKVEE